MGREVRSLLFCGARVVKCLTSVAPVMVWIYGGGYTGGSKAGSGNPAGLLARAQDNGQEGVIYVAMNYRLGLFVSLHLCSRKCKSSHLRAGSRAPPSKRLAPATSVSGTNVLPSNG